MTSSTDKPQWPIDKILERPELKKAFEEGSLSDRRKVALVLSYLPPLKRTELAQALHDIQAGLVAAGHMKAAKFAGYRPPPQLLHSRKSVLRHLDLYQKLQSVIDGAADGAAQANSAHFRIATLITLLIVECGAHSREELIATLETIATTGLREINGFYYVVLPHPGTKGHLADARRLFLSPATTVAALLTPTPLLSDASHAPDDFLYPYATALNLDTLEVSDIISAASTHLEFAQSPPHWLMYWMLNSRILSSNLTESVFLRVNQCDAESANDSVKNNSSYYEDIPEEEAAADDLDRIETERIDVFTAVNEKLRNSKDRQSTVANLEALEAEFDALGGRHPGALQLYGWILYLARTPMATSTIRRLWTAIASRIIALVPEQPLDSLSQEEWESLLSTIADSSQSASTRSITANALNSLASFLNMAYGSETKHLPSGKQVSLANARILTPRELGLTTRYLRSVFTSLPKPLRKAAVSMVHLGWHTGLRRQEMFHLRPSDIKGIRLPVIQVRGSDSNSLKSLSSRRDLPLDLLKTPPLGLTGFSSVELPRDGDDLIFRSTAPEDSAVAPGSARHHALINRIVSGIHEAMREATGDSDAVLHILRHSFATYCMIALLGKRLGLEALSPHFPFLKEALNEDFVGAVRELLLPASYEGNSELEIVRDLMGHASELTTLAHYVHCLDFLRLGVLRPSWRNDHKLIGRIAGVPRSTLGRIKTMEELLELAIRRSAIQVTKANIAPPSNQEQTYEDVSSLLRSFSAALKLPTSATPDQIVRQLSGLERLGIPFQQKDLFSRRDAIAPLAVAFFPTSKRPSSLDSLTPDGESVRTAALACQQLLQAIQDQAEPVHFLSRLAQDCISLLRRRTTVSTSTVTAGSPDDVRSVRNVMSALSVHPESALSYRIRQTTNGSQLVDISSEDADQFFIDPTSIKRTLYIKIRFGKDDNERSDVTTFIWVICAIYGLFGDIIQRDRRALPHV